MDALEAIMTRRSVRQFSDKPIGDKELDAILKAGMSGPSCVNSRDWAFVVVRDKNRILEMAAANGEAANPLKGAVLGIMVCGDLDRAFAKAPDYWIIDGSIATQNMILAARALGIGSVWLGTYPTMDKVKKQAELFNLPKNIVPHSLIAFGYPENPDEAFKQPNSIEPDRVHYEKW